jgi:DNA-binding NarL/FixJ family response regulator
LRLFGLFHYLKKQITNSSVLVVAWRLNKRLLFLSEGKMGQKRMLVAEDHALVREGIIALIEKNKEYTVVAEAVNGNDMVEKYFATKPDIILSDIEMPYKDGIKAAKEIIEKDENAKIIFLSMYDDEKDLSCAIKIGAYGFVSKSAMPYELMQAIKLVEKGNKYFLNKTHEEIQSILVKYKSMVESKVQGVKLSLTRREKEVLQLIAEGFTSYQISEKLYVNVRTIETCRQRMKKKYKLNSTAELILFALKYTARQ